jgi:CxxC motif-containing protein (DUF1111 family)
MRSHDPTASVSSCRSHRPSFSSRASCWGLHRPTPTCPPPANVHGTAIGDALPGLSPDEAERFARGGHQLFRRIYTPEDGLGPLFNENSCNACHTDPADGGTGDQFMIRATTTRSDGSCDLLGGEGANIRQQATPLLRAHGIFFEEVPAAATEVGRFNVPFVFGLGLVEAIPEEVILARVGDPGLHGELSGRAGHNAEGQFARFGRKADVATLFDFVEEASRLEMGLTNPLHSEERGPNLRPLPGGTDPAPNPEIDLASLELLADFVRFLAPIGRREVEDPDTRALVERGEELFREIGCAGCHVPYMDTGPHAVEALAHKRIHLYSDLLLHDMGPELADVCGPAASGSESGPRCSWASPNARSISTTPGPVRSGRPSASTGARPPGPGAASRRWTASPRKR